MKIKVRANPAPGHDVRRRAGRAWGREFVEIHVVDDPAPHEFDEKGKIVKFSDEMSPKQFADLQADPRIHWLPEGADEGVQLEAAAKLAKAEEQIAAANRMLAEAAEVADEERRRGEKMAKEAAEKIAELEALVLKLREDLAAASMPRAVEEPEPRKRPRAG